MGHHTKGRRKRVEPGGPSIWFFIALAIGIALLIWGAARVVTKPVQPATKSGTVFHSPGARVAVRGVALDLRHFPASNA